jgi:hypothetical protein
MRLGVTYIMMATMATFWPARLTEPPSTKAPIMAASTMTQIMTPEKPMRRAWNVSSEVMRVSGGTYDASAGVVDCQEGEQVAQSADERVDAVHQ